MLSFKLEAAAAYTFFFLPPPFDFVFLLLDCCWTRTPLAAFSSADSLGGGGGDLRNTSLSILGGSPGLGAADGASDEAFSEEGTHQKSLMMMTTTTTTTTKTMSIDRSAFCNEEINLRSRVDANGSSPRFAARSSSRLPRPSRPARARDHFRGQEGKRPARE